MAIENYVEMQVELMKQYTANTPKKLRELEIGAEKSVESLQATCEVAREQFYYALIKEIVEEKYDIGKLLEVHQIFGGYVNVTFGIYTEKDGEKLTWLFRKYREGKSIEKLNFEHRMLRHASSHGFSFCAVPIDTVDGKTYAREMVETGTDSGEQEFLFAIFNYIDGVKSYDWMPNWAEEGLAEVTITSGARNMAELHSSTVDFDPQGQQGDSLFLDDSGDPCNKLIAMYPERLQDYRKTYTANNLDNVFTKYFDATYPYVKACCEKATIPDDAYSQMQFCCCHNDFHAGNFKYDLNGKITGSFDYDSAMVDSRLFDLGLGMHYLFASWEPTTNGILRLDRVERFIKYYNQECINIGKIPPLNDIEKQYLYEALLQGPIYVHGWCTTDVITYPDVDAYEYLYYSQHFIQAMEWLEAHESEIRELIKNL